MIDEQSVLNAQVLNLRDRLTWTRQVLEDTRQASPDLYDRLGIRFSLLVEAQEREIDALIAVNNNGDLADTWRRLDVAQRNSRSLSNETLAFLGGLLIRHNNLDRGVCLVADHLFDDLCKAGQVNRGLLAIPAVEDSFTGLSNIIRVRFPEFSIWSLPVAAHEFGHYLDNERGGISFPYMYSQIMEEEGASQADLPILKELFADLVAVYALGPAYTSMCITLEFDPRQAGKRRGDHPSDDDRAYFQLNALRMLMAKTGALLFQGNIKQLDETWSDELSAVGIEAQRENAKLDRRLEKMFSILDDPRLNLSGLRYGQRGLIQAHSIESGLLVPLVRIVGQSARPDEVAMVTSLQRFLTGNAPLPNLRDIFNAAWLYRIKEPRADPRMIDRASLWLCQKSLAEAPMKG